MEQDEVELEVAIADFLDYVQNVMIGSTPQRHECYGACDAPPSTFVRIGMDLYMRVPSWEQACNVLRPLLDSAMKQIEEFSFCFTWTLQGPKKRGTTIRLSMAFPQGDINETIVAAYFRGEQSHAIHGEYARLFADILLREGSFDPSCCEDITNCEL
jgi:hypothetical protein